MVGKDEGIGIGIGTGAAAPFLRKTYEMVDDPESDSMVSWSPDKNNSFVVWNVPLFSTHLLPFFFKHNNFSSFLRQLNTYGFRKVSDRWEFVNEGFVRGHKHLLKGINRRKPVQPLAHHQHPSIHNAPPKPCVHVAKFGIEEDVERLKMDKNVLMQELVRLRQQQSSTDTQLHTAGQRVQVMEQKQQQMMSFLAKAMHSPAFLSQLVQNKNDGNRQITGVNRKRRLPNHDEDILGMRAAFPDGQIVKYQPLINEAAKSMLRQILKLNANLPDRSPTSFLLDFVPAASSVVHNPSRISGVTLSEVSQTYQQPCFSTETGFSDDLASEIISNDVPIPEPALHNPLGDSHTSNFNQINQTQGVTPENSLRFPGTTFSGAPNRAISFLDSLSSVQNGTLPMEVGECSPGVELDGILPGSNDAFWEQFFPVSPSAEATEEVDLSGTAKDHEQGEDEGSEELHHMNHLTEQMGLLTAEIEKV